MQQGIIDYAVKKTIWVIEKFPDKEPILKFKNNLKEKLPEDFLKVDYYYDYFQILCHSFQEERGLEKTEADLETLKEIFKELKHTLK